MQRKGRMGHTRLCVIRHGETAWNAEGRVQVDTCRARFESPGLIAGSPIGLLARNGGSINLNMRGDVSVVTVPEQIALNAEATG